MWSVPEILPCQLLSLVPVPEALLLLSLCVTDLCASRLSGFTSSVSLLDARSSRSPRPDGPSSAPRLSAGPPACGTSAESAHLFCRPARATGTPWWSSLNGQGDFLTGSLASSPLGFFPPVRSPRIPPKRSSIFTLGTPPPTSPPIEKVFVCVRFF